MVFTRSKKALSKLVRSRLKRMDLFLDFWIWSYEDEKN